MRRGTAGLAAVALCSSLLLAAPSARAGDAGDDLCRWHNDSAGCIQYTRPSSEPPGREGPEPVCDLACQRREQERLDRLRRDLPPASQEPPAGPGPDESVIRSYDGFLKDLRETDGMQLVAMIAPLPVAALAGWMPPDSLLPTPGGRLHAAPARSALDPEPRPAEPDKVKQCEDAKERKNSFCHGEGGIESTCDGVRDCAELKKRLGLRLACEEARVDVIDVCHDGIPDDGHRQALDNLRKGTENCFGRIEEHCDKDPCAGRLLVKLMRAVQSACSAAAYRGCFLSDSCATLAAKTAGNRACLAARGSLQDRCRGNHGDPQHDGQVSRARDRATQCEALFQEKRCVEEARHR